MKYKANKILQRVQEIVSKGLNLLGLRRSKKTGNKQNGIEGIDDAYLQKAIDSLEEGVGVKDFADSWAIRLSINKGKVKEGITEIAKQLGLPIKINLFYVSAEYQSNANPAFGSSHLTKTDKNGKGNQGITAQVYIPKDLPMYGTPRLDNFPISVKISENCKENHETFISVMAHELSHVFLYSIGHKERDNEIYTDLTAMMLGFSDIIKRGRRVTKVISEDYDSRTTRTTTYGYLSDKQFRTVYKEIIWLLERNLFEKEKVKKKVRKLRQKIIKGNELISCFHKYIEYLGKNLNLKIKPKDGVKISSFHATGHIDKFKANIQKSEKILANSTPIFQSSIYFKDYTEKAKKCREKIDSIFSELNYSLVELNKEVRLLRKYLPIRQRLKSAMVSVYEPLFKFLSGLYFVER
jgi:hypothetical protein